MKITVLGTIIDSPAPMMQTMKMFSRMWVLNRTVLGGVSICSVTQRIPSSGHHIRGHWSCRTIVGGNGISMLLICRSCAFVNPDVGRSAVMVFNHWMWTGRRLIENWFRSDVLQSCLCRMCLVARLGIPSSGLCRPALVWVFCSSIFLLWSCWLTVGADKLIYFVFHCSQGLATSNCRMVVVLLY